VGVGGSVIRRGKSSWRIKFEAGDRDPVTGKRRTRYVTLRGTKKEAQAEFVRLLAQVDAGTAVDPSRITVGGYIRTWLDGATHPAPKTAERYRELVEKQIVPRLGEIPLQRLRPARLAEWHAELLRSGGRDGRPLAPRTVGHAHRVLHSALARAAKLELVSRNVAAVLAPPAVVQQETESLTDAQIADTLAKLQGHVLYSIAVTALGTGMRRGELCGLRWQDVDLDAALVVVEHSLEETDAGLRLKSPKSRHGRRRITLPESVVTELRAHRVKQLEMRLVLGAGRPSPTDYVFDHGDGSPRSPDTLSQQWKRAATALGLPPISFHGLRHTHASALIAAG
jgi:integrase